MLSDDTNFTELELKFIAAMMGLEGAGVPKSLIESVLEAARIDIPNRQALCKGKGPANFCFNRTMANLCNNAIGQPMSDDPMGDVSARRKRPRP